ncbi:MAG: phosphoribosylamine--glycine ligase [Pseudomonadota bacterium]
MKVLVIGGGGREHALAWKLTQSEQVEHVYVAPGNAGTAAESGISNIKLDVDDSDALLSFAQDNGIGLTVIGPEAPLVNGIVDAFQAANLQVFGPTAGAAQLEGSKAYSKDFLARHRIPTARYQVFSELAAASEYIATLSTPVVVKADGLAAGKGVVIADTHASAVSATTDMLSGNRFGAAGHRVVIEEFMHGEEASFICMVDGKNILPLATSQDHKARDDGDVGPNTGGMGAYSPAPVIDAAMHEQVMQNIIRPTVDGMAADGHPFTGFLYAGLMICNDGVARVVEFNVRFGDPETQPILMRMRGDLASLCIAACKGQLDSCNVGWDPRSAVGVVMAAGGYPDNYAKGKTITGLGCSEPADAKVFHAGTALDAAGNTVTSGGRVLCVVGLGNSVREAQQRAYDGVDAISWDDAYWRRDIGHRAIARE